jgi:hypothetical protein
MTRLVSLFGGTVTDTEVQVVKENQEIIPDYAQAVIIACEREDRSDVHTFFFHRLIFFNGYTSVFIYLHTHLFA